MAPEFRQIHGCFQITANINDLAADRFPCFGFDPGMIIPEHLFLGVQFRIKKQGAVDDDSFSIGKLGVAGYFFIAENNIISGIDPRGNPQLI